MAVKRKKLPQSLPDVISVDLIVWNDHSSSHGDPIKLDILKNISIGANIYEDDEQVILFQTGDPEDNPFTTSDNDTTQILKSTIVKRKTLFTLPWPLWDDAPAS